MSRLKNLIREIHSRSLWQVLGIYAGVSWAVFEVVQTLTEGLGLPAWVPPLALVLLLIGLPIVMATAFVQKGVPQFGSRDPTLLPELGAGIDSQQSGGRVRSTLQQLFTWRKAILGGLLAFSLAGVAVSGYMAMRTLGIGPLGTLMAKGVLEPREPIVLAEVEDHAGDSTLALAVTEALRVDLSQSPVVRVAERSLIRDALERMERDADTPLELELARELAVREGLKAVLAGEVHQVGKNYVLTGRLISAESGDVLVARRETAEGADEVVPAVDRLSAHLRERIGESLKSIRDSKPLPRVTTESLDALRKYALARREVLRGQFEAAISLLGDAVRLDSTFSTAYRHLALTLSNVGVHGDTRTAATVAAMEKALAHSDRLTERERLYLRGDYHDEITGNYEAVIEVLRARRELEPDCCLGELGIAYARVGDLTKAEAYSRRDLESDSGGSVVPYWNVMLWQVGLGKLEAAESTLAALVRHFPDHYLVQLNRANLAALRGDYESAEAYARKLREKHTSLAIQEEASEILAGLAQLQGRLTEAQEYWRDAMALSERRKVPAEYVRIAIRLAEVDLWYRNDREAALATVDAALERYPLDSMPPLDRPCLPPGRAGFIGELCGFWALAGEPDRAKSLFSEFEASDNPILKGRMQPLLQGIRGLIALSEGRADEAIADLRRYHQALPCTICALPYLGQAYELAGQPDSALAVYERYVENDWIDRYRFDRTVLPFVYERLGALHEDAGHPSEAIRYHRTLIDLWKNADPELQPRIDSARRAIARLSGEPA